MKKSLFFLLGMLMITSASAAEYQYVPLVREGVKWVEYYENDDIPIPENQKIIFFQFKGTTTIADNNYHNLYATIETDIISNESVPIAFVRENDKKVYAMLNYEFPFANLPISYNLDPFNCCKFWREVENYYEYLIYDFNDISCPYVDDLMTGEPVVSTYDYGDYSVNNYTIPTNALFDFSLDEIFCDFQVREGIGTLHDVFINPWPVYPTNGSKFNLAWVEENGEIIFKGGFYEKAKGLNTSIVATHFDASKQVASVRYYNLAGVESNEPFKGMNIRVTTYTDGTRHTEKVVR